MADASVEAQVAAILREAQERQSKVKALEKVTPAVYHLTNRATGEVFKLEDTFRPTAKQLAFFKATKREVLYGGARGGAKTRAICEDAKLVALQWPGIPIIIGRKDLQDIKRTTEVEWRRAVNPAFYAPENGGAHNKSENRYTFPNGSTVIFTELKDPESWRSATLGRIYIDEAKEIPEDTVRDLKGALRWTSNTGRCNRTDCYRFYQEQGLSYEAHGEHPRYQVKMATNPAPGWLRDKFWLPAKLGRPLPGYEFIASTVFDNPYLSSEYIMNLLDNPPQWVQNFVHGDWASFENMAFPQFYRTTHTWSGPLPKFTRVHGGVDYGSTSQTAHRTAAYLTGETADRRFITFWEYSEAGAPSEKLFAALAEATKMHRVEWWWADASQFITNETMRKSGALPMLDAPRHQGAVKEGINIIDRLMSPRPTGGPGWFVTENCVRLIAAIESYALDPVTGLPDKKGDDEIDAFRYSIMGLAQGSGPINVQPVAIIGSPPSEGRLSGIIAMRKAERHARLAQWMRANPD